MYDRLLVAVDGSDEARHAARRGVELADRFDARVDVVFVVPRSARRLARSPGEKRRLRERGKTALSEVEYLASDRGQLVSTELIEGKPAVEISDYARQRDADLLVVGRQGTTGLGKRLLGGVTEGLLARSDLPVAVVPHDLTESALTVSDLLVPTDGSDNAAAAAPHGRAVADRFGASLHVLNVVDLQAAGGLFSAGGLEREFLDRLDAEGQRAVDETAAEIRAVDPEIEVTTAVERTTSFDGAAAGIRAYADAHGVDLIVMGSQGRSNLGRQLLGSVASTVLRTVAVPVIVVPRGA